MIQTLDKLKAIELETSWISKLENGIIWIDYKNDVDIDVENVVDVGNTIVELCDGIPHFFVIDVRNCHGNYSAEAREYIASNSKVNAVRRAYAILSDSLGTRILANFYLKINKPPSPGKLFGNEYKALEWIDSLR